MAFNWSKVFQNWTWHNRSQAKDTPLNATNLKKINDAIDTLDDRVVAVGGSLDTEVVKTTGSQTVGGNKTFSDNISVLKSGENKGYIGLILSYYGSSIVLKKQDPSDTVTPVNISANALSQYYGTAATPYRIQLGEYGVKADKIKLSSNGEINAQRYVLGESPYYLTERDCWLPAVYASGGVLGYANGLVYMGVPSFSSSNSYEVGDYVIYDDVLYKCTTAHQGAWDRSHFTARYGDIVTTQDVAARTFGASGAGYAEKFEPLDTCPSGRFVTLDGDKVKLARNGNFILGVTLDNPSVMGDKDSAGIPVGVVGKLAVEDDGTAQAGGFVKCGVDGIAIAGTESDGYQVLSRIDSSHVKIWFMEKTGTAVSSGNIVSVSASVINSSDVTIDQL